MSTLKLFLQDYFLHILGAVAGVFAGYSVLFALYSFCIGAIFYGIIYCSIGLYFLMLVGGMINELDKEY